MKRFLPIILFLTACSTVPVDTKPVSVEPKLVHVVIVSTTDLHGWYDSHHATRTVPGFGGLPLLAGYVEVLRAHYPGRVVVVDSGDLFQGTMESNLFEGEPVVKGYNAVGYDAVAIGNHEFDYGPAGPDSVVRKPGQDPLGALKKNASMARFPFLSANLTEASTGRTPSWAKPYTIVGEAGTRIGIIGLSTPDTPNVTTESNVETLRFGDPVAATVSAAKELRTAGVQAVIVIAHMGGRCKVIDANPEDSSSCENDMEAMRFLKALPKGTIDAYFGGHTHSQMRNYVNGVPALQPAPFGREFAMVDMTIDDRTHKLVKTDLAPLTMLCSEVYENTETCDPKKAAPNAQLVIRKMEGRVVGEMVRVREVLKPYLDQVAAKKNQEVGITTKEPFRRRYSRESALGDLIADGMRAYLKTDFAFINSGGIRSDLPAGALLYANLFDVSPFDNFPAIVTMTGAQIKQMLQITSIGGGRGILQASGLHYTYDEALDADKPAAQRNRVTAVTLPDGQPLDPAATYRVAMVDFLATGGEGLDPVMKQIPADRITIDYSHPIRDVLIEALKVMPQPLEPKLDGRITVLNPKDPNQD
jgi:5'-nucleotidase